MQSQHSVTANEDDVIMTSPFAMDGAFDKQCLAATGGNSLLSNIIHGDNCDDWANMDCDDDEEDKPISQHHSHRLVRGGSGMVSHDSIGSIESSSSSSSTQENEPELSQSFGSTRSFDLMTPIKPNAPSHVIEAMQRFAYAKTTQTNGFVRRDSLPSPKSKTNLLELTSLNDSITSQKHLHQQRHYLGESMGLNMNLNAEGGITGLAKSGTVRSGRPAPPGLAGRLKIQLPSASAFSGPSVPQTPGGHVAVGARDGAADGGPPMSPFEPPTPLQAPSGSPFNSSKALPAPSPSPSSLRPKLQQRHTITPYRHESSNVLGMSPITSQFAAVSMRKASSSKGSVSDASTRGCSITSESSSTSGTSTNTLLTPPYSPYSATKALPSELDVPLPSSERRTSAGSITSNTGGSNTSSSAKKRNDVVRSSVSSTRPKTVKMANKVSPYKLSRDEAQAKSPTTTTSIESPTSKYLPGPIPARVEVSSPPSLLKDIVKPPMPAPAMEKCASEPVPKTVSARHLAHKTLHPTFSANYTLGDELGSGGFGFVVGATRDRDGMPVAVKFIFKDKVPSHGWVRDDVFGAIPMEAFVLKVVDSPFVVKFVDLFDDDQFFYLVMEHHGSPWKAPGGEGEKKVVAVDEGVSLAKKEGTMILSPTSSAMKSSKSQPNVPPAPTVPSPTFAVFPPESETPQSAENNEDAISVSSMSSPSSKSDSLEPLRPAAMERRSSCDLFECIEQHSRLSEDKARWVFAQIVEAVYYLDRRGICHRDIKDENCVIDSDFNVKLIDFGSSVITDPRRPTPYFNRFFGTMTFASSEILQGKQYRAPNAEVWSLGVLLSILLSGECPFADPTAAIKGKISKPNGMWSSDALNLLMACLTVNPDKRATIGQIRNHPWVAKAWLQPGRRRPSDDFSYSGSG